jgi:hypothetical protein
MAVYQVETCAGLVDLDKLTKQDWDDIKALQRSILDEGEFDSPFKATCAAFITWVAIRSEVLQPFDPKVNIMQ